MSTSLFHIESVRVPMILVEPMGVGMSQRRALVQMRVRRAWRVVRAMLMLVMRIMAVAVGVLHSDV